MATSLSLPSNYEAECNVLGACLLSKSAASIVISSLNEASFLDRKNVLVYKAMKELLERGEPIDPTVVNDELINQKADQEVGGIDYLLYLSDSVMNPDNLNHYIKIVQEQQVLRNLLLTLSDAQKDYANGGIANIGEFVANVNQKINEIANSRQVGDFRTSGDVAEEVRLHLKELQNYDNKGVVGLDTGYKKLNEATHGWNPGDLIIVAARPAMGKTALTLNLAYHSALRSGKPVAFFSLEMDSASLMNRLIANRSMVSNDKLQTGYLSSSDKVKIASAIDEISKVPLYFDDTPDILLGDIIAKSTKFKDTHKDLAMIVIDYLGHIRTTKNGKVESREREVAMITGQLKQLARTLKVPVMLICQINRNAENNDAKRPSMANLRESGSIEADADKVLLLYREDYYTAVGQSVAKKKSFKEEAQERSNSINNHQPAPQETQKPGQEKENSVMDIIIAKSRNGKVGTIQLLFSKQYSRFDNLSEEFEEVVNRHEKAMAGSGEYLE